MIQKKKDYVQAHYDKIGSNYDSKVNLVFLGLDRIYRKKAINKLNLKEGDTVLELGCGTGVNFEYIMKKIGPKGKIIGVDISLSMLEVAKKRKEKKKWNNIELIQQDITKLKLNQKVDAIFTMFVMSLVKGYKDAVRIASTYLKKGGSFVMLDGKEPKGYGKMFFPIAKYVGRKFSNVDRDFKKELWIVLMKSLNNVDMTEHALGMVFIAKAIKS